MATVHIKSNIEDISDVVLMPGDPKRSEYIAKNFLSDYKLVNDVRGMTAYTGYYKNRLVTIFPSGMGNPSMGIYSYELFKEYNVKNIIRIGSCGVYDKNLKLNDVILVTGSCSESSYGYELDRYDSKFIESSNFLNDMIEKSSIEKNMNITKGNIFCADAFYEYEYDYEERASLNNVLGVEMETFALFNNARKLGKNATALLTVSDLFYSDEKLSSDDREKKLNDMIILALESCLKL